eukprot:jgi/Galph1/2604/GphlegSOOS_G1269.1
MHSANLTSGYQINEVCGKNNLYSHSEEIDNEHVIFVDGKAYNSRGFRVCGAPNQRGSYCARFGHCPFHGNRKQGTIEEYDKTNDNSKEESPLTKLCMNNKETRFKAVWKVEEHERFLKALKLFGHGNWIQIAEYVGTRTASQCQSHAQKYYLRKKKRESKASLKRSIFDVVDENTLSLIEREEHCASKTITENNYAATAMGGAWKGKETEYQLDSVFGLIFFQMETLKMDPKMQLPSTLTAFFIQAAELLKMKFATRAFTRSGFEICSLHEVCPGDILWISSGEDFIFPSLTTNTLQFEN